MNNVCRTCLSASNLTLLKEDESLIDKIELLSSVHISLDVPNYPNTICNECIQKVNDFHCFRKIIINSDKELKEKCELLNNEATKKIPLSTRRKRSCGKPLRTRSSTKAGKPHSKIVTTATPNNCIKTEPTELENRLVVVFCDNDITENKELPETVLDDNSVKEENVEENKINGSNDSTCYECSVTFLNEKELDDHKKAFHRQKYRKKPKSLDCKECNTTFNSLTELSNHKRTLHTAPGICSICGVIVRADNLKKHVQKHSEGPVSCKICSKVLKNSESLRGHLLIHRGTSFECKDCDKTFRLKSEYHRHLKKHIDPNVRKKMCSICGKHVRDIQRHLFTHTGERPYICTHCNKGLTSSYALKLHIRQHTNEKPYICEYCSKGFAQKISLVAHLKSKIHSNVV